jgi:hypothetical protein
MVSSKRRCPLCFLHGSSTQPPWKAWYKTARWQRLRLEIFKRDHYTCQCGCVLIEGDASQLVADHKEKSNDLVKRVSIEAACFRRQGFISSARPNSTGSLAAVGRAVRFDFFQAS